MPPSIDPEILPDEATIHQVVHRFYEKIRHDPLLGPVFEARLEGRWPEHLATMVDFWSSVLLTTRRYRGRPLTTHRQLGQITPEMWARWIQLFTETTREHAPKAAADLFAQRAQQIAGHLAKSLDRAPSPMQLV